MAFSLPSDLPTNVVDDSTTVDAAFFNNLSGMGNALKAAIGTFGFGSRSAYVATAETTNSTSYTDLTTTTDQVTVAIGSSGMALVTIKSDISCANNYGLVGYALSGANTVAASDSKAIQFSCQYGSNRLGVLSATFLETGLTAGITTFKLKYKSNSTSNTQTFTNRNISVIPFPSTDGTHASGTFNVDATSVISLGMTGAALNRPTYDATGSGYGTATTVTTGSCTHTGASGATPILAVGFGCSTADCVLSATYGGTAMVEIGRIHAANTGNTGAVVFGLLGACDGTEKTVTFTSSKNLDMGLTMQCISYTNVGSIGQPIYNPGGAANPTVTTTAILPGSLAVHGLQVQRSTAITGFNQTSRYSDARGTYDGFLFGEAPNPSTAGASITFSATTATNHGGITIPLNPTAHPIPADKTSSTVLVGPTTGTTFTHTGASGTTPIVMVATDSGSTPFSGTTASVTYNGAAMTQIGWVPTYSTYNMGIGLFVKQGACTGSACNVVVTVSPSMQGLMASCTSYSNVTSVTSPTIQAAGAAQPSLTIPSAAGQRAVAAWRNHYSTAKGFSQGTGITRFNDNTYRVSSANAGTAMMIDAPASSASTTSLSAYTTISYGLGGLGTALTTASPVTVGYDAVGAGVYWSGSTGGNWNHTVAGNALIVFGTMWYNAGFTFGWTVNGQAATPTLTSQLYFNNGSYFGSAWCWTLLNPPTGTVNIACSVTSGPGPLQVTMNSVSYTNVGLIGTPLTNIGTSTTPTTSAAGHLSSGRIVQAFGSDGTNTFTSYNQTQRYNQGYHASDARPLVIGDAAGNASGVSFTVASSPAVDYTGVYVPLWPTYFV